jgi:polar amino acid transport system substrate-binding protein
MFWRAQSFFLALVVFAAFAGTAAAGPLEDIKARGEIVVGTKTDFPPFGFRNEQGEIVGIEADLAADVARRLGVKLRLEAVLPWNRIPLLHEGKIDVVIATMYITDDRRATTGFIDPPYYAGGVAGLARPGAGVRSEDDLNGKAVCAVKGNFFNKELQSKYVQKELVVAETVPDAKRALQEGRCVIFVYVDAMLIQAKKIEAETWKDYDLIEFMQVDPIPWGIGIKPADLRTSYGRFFSNTVIDWHRSGFLAATEKKWLGKNTAWVNGVHLKYKTRR